DRYTSDSNAAFDQWLKSLDAYMGSRDAEAVDALAAAAGFALFDDVAMPANNRCRVWQRSRHCACTPPPRACPISLPGPHRELFVRRPRKNEGVDVRPRLSDDAGMRANRPTRTRGESMDGLGFEERGRVALPWPPCGSARLDLPARQALRHAPPPDGHGKAMRARWRYGAGSRVQRRHEGDRHPDPLPLRQSRRLRRLLRPAA